jgi:hypothetical protein
MITAIMALIVAALVVTIVSAMGKCPLWPAVLILCVIGMLEHFH